MSSLVKSNHWRWRLKHVWWISAKGPYACAMNRSEDKTVNAMLAACILLQVFLMPVFLESCLAMLTAVQTTATGSPDAGFPNLFHYRRSHILRCKLSLVPRWWIPVWLIPLIPLSAQSQEWKVGTNIAHCGRVCPCGGVCWSAFILLQASFVRYSMLKLITPVCKDVSSDSGFHSFFQHLWPCLRHYYSASSTRKKSICAHRVHQRWCSTKF